MNIIWSDEAWEDYLYWQTQDKKTLKRINALVKDIDRNGPMEGIGEPEALKGNLQGLSTAYGAYDIPIFGGLYSYLRRSNFP
jgi:Txe/YoeB family toxin of Txe-Axe toxin-antitoxin module